MNTEAYEGIDVKGEATAVRIATMLIVERSAMFKVTPHPDDVFIFGFKAGEGHTEAILKCLEVTA